MEYNRIVIKNALICMSMMGCVF